MLTLNSESYSNIKREHALKNEILVYLPSQDLPS